jgi:hypothetical protein
MAHHPLVVTLFVEAGLVHEAARVEDEQTDVVVVLPVEDDTQVVNVL